MYTQQVQMDLVWLGQPVKMTVVETHSFIEGEILRNLGWPNL